MCCGPAVGGASLAHLEISHPPRKGLRPYERVPRDFFRWRSACTIARTQAAALPALDVVVFGAMVPRRRAFWASQVRSRNLAAALLCRRCGSAADSLAGHEAGGPGPLEVVAA